MPTPQAGTAEILSLTALRGVAAWCVVLHHVPDMVAAALGERALGWSARGYLAVDLFFVLSGFVLARRYQAELTPPSPTGYWPGYLSFLGRRAARTYPLHLAVLLLYLTIPLAILLFSTQKNVSDKYGLGYYLLSLVFLQNWGFTDRLAWNLPAWSLSTEWLAYLLFPLLVGATGFAARRRALPVLVACLLLAVAVVFAWAGGLGQHIPRYGAARCVLECWLGACLFRLAPAVPSRASRTTAGAACLALLAAHAGLGLPDYLTAPAAFMCLVFALSRDDGPAAAVLAHPVLQWIGRVSYSTYLVHFFVREWVKFTLVRDGIPVALALLAYVLLTLAASALLYRHVELPGRTALRRLLAKRAAARRPSPA